MPNPQQQKRRCSPFLGDLSHSDLKIDVIKNVNNKKCAPELIFLNKDKVEKDSDDFRCRKLTLKVKFWHFLRPSY